jgi:hypothetical protein
MLDDDAWVRGETQRFHTLRNSLHHMASMQKVLHDVFVEVVKSDSWSFFAIRQLREYHEPANWDFLTRNSSHADDILQHHKERIEGHAQGLAKELLGNVAGTLGEANGEILKQTPKAWKEIESVLVKASDVVQDHKVSNPALHSGIQGSLLHLKSMIDDGTPLPELGHRALKRTLPENSEGRRSRYHLAEHWTGLSNAQLAFMKTVLALDYGEWKENPEQVKTKLPDLLLDVTLLQQEFVVTEAQADRDLRTAQNTLYHALTL